MSGRARTTGRIRSLTLAAVVLVVSTGTLPNQSQRVSAAPLAAGSDFTITSTISSSATSADQPAVLSPGVTRYLWFRVSNPLRQPITVTSLGITRVDAPATCPLANLDLGDPTFTGAVVVPARGTTTVPAPKPIALINMPDINQDACKNVTFTFTFAGTGWYSDSPNLAKVGTATVLVTTPGLAAVGTPVTLTARVIPDTTSGSGTGAAGFSSGGPTGIVTFYLTTSSGREILLGTGTLGPEGTASLRITSVPPGAGRLHAVYSGTETFAASTSPSATLSIVAPPAQCTATYSTSIIGTPESPAITGTSGNDFIYAVGADYRVTSGKGNDCVIVGDGNNVVAGGSGADVVIAGNGRNTVTVLGSRNVVVVGDGAGNRVTVKGTKKAKKVRRTNGNVVTVGDGSANRVTLGRGSANQVTVGDGASNRVTVRKGPGNVVTIGDGARNRVTVTGSKNRVTVGKGTANRLTVGKGTKNRITVGNGGKNRITVKGSKNKVILGRGTKNRVVVRAGSKPRTTCSLPTPPRTWRGSPVRYYRDTLIRCRVVTR
jgi:hypothetical protein